MNTCTTQYRRGAARQRGFTLIELMVAIAIAGILLAVAAAPFGSVVARMRLEGAANELGTDLQWARSECIRTRVAVSLTTSDAGTSYSITSGGNTLKSVTHTGNLKLAGQVAGVDAAVTITFDPLRGMANAATVLATSTGTSAKLQIVTDAMGRVRVCTPDGSFKGYATC